MSSDKKGSVRDLCYKLQISFWYPAVAELKSFSASCVVVVQQYSLNFILVSHFHFEVLGIMAGIFLLANFFCLSFAISQPVFTCSKLTIETLEQVVKYVQR